MPQVHTKYRIFIGKFTVSALPTCYIIFLEKYVARVFDKVDLISVTRIMG